MSVSAVGWPATGGRWAVVGGWEQGGVKGWYAPWQFPADGLTVWGKLAHVGIAVALTPCGAWDRERGQLGPLRT